MVVYEQCVYTLGHLVTVRRKALYSRLWHMCCLELPQLPCDN